MTFTNEGGLLDGLSVAVEKSLNAGGMLHRVGVPCCRSRLAGARWMSFVT